MRRWTTTKISTISTNFHELPPADCDVFGTLRPVLRSLQIAGVYTTRHERPRPYRTRARSWYDDVSVWTCVSLGLLHAYVVAACVSCALSDDVWATSYAVVRTTAAVVTAHAVVKHRADVCDTLRRLAEFGGGRDGSLKWMAAGSAATVWTFLAVAVLARWKLFLEHDSALTAHLDRAWCGLGPSFSADYSRPLACLDVLVNVFFVDGVFLNGVALYLCLAVALRHRFASLNDSIRDLALKDGSSPPVSAQELRRLRGLQHDLGSMVLRQDGLFSPTAFAWVCFFVLGTCIQVTRFFQLRKASRRQHGHKADEAHQFVFFCQDMVQILGVFLTVTITASRLTETARGSIVLVHRALRHDRGSTEKTWTGRDQTLADVFREGQLFVAQLTAAPVVLTGWNFFDFSRGFVLTLAGALLSYILIILQLDPDS